MPELPEVENAARVLREALEGARVVRAEGAAARVFRGGSRPALLRALAGRRLLRVDRRGKVLLLAFDADVGVRSHLGMTGRWISVAAGDAPPRHGKLRLDLEGGAAVHYCDPRMFGQLTLHRASELSALPDVRALGPDPIADGIDAGALHASLARTRRAVKAALLDQSVLAGVGNIYATEALFRARVHPAREGRSISLREVMGIARALDAVFAEAIARMGENGEYLSDGSHVANPFQIYDRAGEPCPRCRRDLEKATIGGRTSAFCARCQK